MSCISEARPCKEPGFFCACQSVRAKGCAGMKTIPVFHCPEMSVDSRGYSLLASIPGRIVADWAKPGLAINVHRSFPEVEIPRTVWRACHG